MSITCASCEACCCRLKVALLPGDDVPPTYVEDDERGEPVMARLADGWCVALDRGSLRCTIYARRPFLCRAFGTGSRECREQRAAVRSGIPP